jgi:hypothetical protein
MTLRLIHNNVLAFMNKTICFEHFRKAKIRKPFYNYKHFV